MQAGIASYIVCHHLRSARGPTFSCKRDKCTSSGGGGECNGKTEISIYQDLQNLGTILAVHTHTHTHGETEREREREFSIQRLLIS